MTFWPSPFILSLCRVSYVTRSISPASYEWPAITVLSLGWPQVGHCRHALVKMVVVSANNNSPISLSLVDCVFIALHCISFLFFLVLFCCTVYYCLFSFSIFSEILLIRTTWVHDNPQNDILVMSITWRQVEYSFTF